MNNLVGTSPLVPMPTGAPGVIIKLYFYQNNDGTDPDVRKFSANREELTYDNLTKKIREIYNDTIEECFSVQYLDQEGDKVTFRSTEELNNALNDQVNPPFKFQIKSKRKLSSTEHNPGYKNSLEHSGPEGLGEDEIHSGCLCTSCHQNIRGFRYKCLTCCSYDLCHRCEAKGIHPAHDMIRISSASRSYPPHFFSRLQRLWEKNHHQSSHSISSTSSTPPNKSSIILEPIAKDLVDEDVHSDQDDLESFMTAGTDICSVEELTKNVQSLIDKDNVQENDTESVISVEPKEQHETKESLEENHDESKEEEFVLKESREENNIADKEQEHEVKSEESIIIVEKHELVSLDGTDKAIETALDGTETKAFAVLESKKLEEPTASLDHNKLPDFNELKKEKGEDDKSRTTLCRLQEEIDKLLAPLTPSAVTPHHEEVINADIEEEDIEFENEDQEIEDQQSSSSSVSSSPFELCEIITETTALVESGNNKDHNLIIIEPSKQGQQETDIKNCQTATKIEEISSKNSSEEQKMVGKKIFKIGKQIIEDEDDSIQVISTEIVKEASVESKAGSISTPQSDETTTPVPPKSREGTPVPLEEAEQLLKIVDEQDRLDRQKFGISGDSYMMASSRLLMRNQLRQQNVVKKSKSPDISPMTRSRSMNYTNDSYEFRAPHAAAAASLMANSYTMGESSTSRPYSSGELSTSRPYSSGESSTSRPYSSGESSTSRPYSARPSSYYTSTSNTGSSSTYDRNSKITEAVGQMKSMGFSDEGGWLTQLCSTKRGNIEEILDVLAPVKK